MAIWQKMSLLKHCVIVCYGANMSDGDRWENRKMSDIDIFLSDSDSWFCVVCP